jgi:hypothetical protein
MQGHTGDQIGEMVTGHVPAMAAERKDMLKDNTFRLAGVNRIAVV